MGVNDSLLKTVTRQRRGCDLNPGPSARESSTLTTRLTSHPIVHSGGVYRSDVFRNPASLNYVSLALFIIIIVIILY